MLVHINLHHTAIRPLRMMSSIHIARAPPKNMANMVLSFQPYLFRSAAALVGAVVALRVGPALSAIALKVGDALNGASVTRKP